MNILLVRPKPHRNSIGLHSFMICEPLELEYIYSYMEKDGHNITIIDMILEKKPLKYFIRKYKPDAVGFTAYLTHVGVVKQYAQEVKQVSRSCVTIVGGVHAEVVPEDFEDKNIDYIVKANGLTTFKEIVDHLDRPAEVNKQQISGIWKDRHKQYSIDTCFNYPHPNRESTRKYRSKYHYVYHSRCATVKTSFGCPYRCEFCFCTQITGGHYYERPMEDVIQELKGIKEQNVFIVDDNFLLKRERVEAFCRLLRKHHIRKKYIMFGRADFIASHGELIGELAELGLQAVFVGIESFKDSELDHFNKQTRVEWNVEAIRIMENYGVQCYSGIIAGLDWDKADFDHLAVRLNSFQLPAAINLQPLTPMPGTSLYEQYKTDITIPREQYERWDMAHISLQPAKLSVSQYYVNLLRTYYKTSASWKAQRHILSKYGCITYLRVLKGALHISCQYLKLIISSRGK